MVRREPLITKNVSVDIRDPSAKLAMLALSSSPIPSGLANPAKTSPFSPTTPNVALTNPSAPTSAPQDSIRSKSTPIARMHSTSRSPESEVLSTLCSWFLHS